MQSVTCRNILWVTCDYTHICFHSYILVSTSGNICGEGQRLCLELLDMEVDSKLLGGPSLFIFGGIQFQVETYHWI